MQIKLSERAKECSSRMKELDEEMQDYNHIVLCIKALSSVADPTKKHNYTQAEYDAVVAKVRSLCAKHEIKLPDGDYVEWGTVEII